MIYLFISFLFLIMSTKSSYSEPTSSSYKKVTVTIYSKERCPYCDAAKRLLKNKIISSLKFKNVKVKEVMITSDEERNALMQRIEGRKTFPQIFINDDLYVGGYDDLARLSDRGILDDALLSASSSSQTKLKHIRNKLRLNLG